MSCVPLQLAQLGYNSHIKEVTSMLDTVCDGNKKFFILCPPKEYLSFSNNKLLCVFFFGCLLGLFCLFICVEFHMFLQPNKHFKFIIDSDHGSFIS